MSRRTKRVAALLRGELGQLFVGSVSDPRLKDIVITDVQMTPDLKVARVFFSGEKVGPHVAEYSAALEKVIPYLKRQLGNLPLRFVPELRFEYDAAGEAAGRVLSLLEEIRTNEVGAQL